MFSDVRSALHRADEELRRVVRRGEGAEPVTESEVRALRSTARALRKQLAQIVDEEIAPNNEACGVATDGMEMLRKEVGGRRSARDELQGVLEGARDELGRVEDACTWEKEERERCRRNTAEVKEETARLREDEVNLRAEMDQMNFFQKSVDTETMHRLRADVQNLDTDLERDHIRLRHLNSDRKRLRSELEELRTLRDAHRIVVADQGRALDEAKMTQDMCKVHQEALLAHLKDLGGDPYNIFEALAVGGLGMSVRIKAIIGENLRRERILSSRGSRVGTSEDGRKKDRSPSGEGQGAMVPRPGQSPPERTKQVGGVVLGADTTAESPSEFLRKLPTIFKMGNNVCSDDYIISNGREVEFSIDSNSISDISDVTMEEGDAWMDTLSNVEGRPKAQR